MPPAWRMAKRLGLHTQPDFFQARYGSPLLAGAVALVGVVSIVPYLQLQLTGLGLIVETASAGAVDSTLAIVVAFALTTALMSKQVDGVIGEPLDASKFAPVMERISSRLLLTADLMRHSGKEPALVGKTVATACSLVKYELPYHYHPFLRRFALESMDMAREALTEGYDLRQHGDGTDDDDWE